MRYNDSEQQPDGRRSGGNNGHSHDENRDYRGEVYSLRVPAGKRTYFFDVKSTRSGEDFFLTITESKRIGEGRYEKHKLFLYKEDFGKFTQALQDVMDHIRTECLPGYEFDDMPDAFLDDEASGEQ